MNLRRFQLMALLVALAALVAYYAVDMAGLARATFIVVRDLKAQSQETAAAVSKLMHESEESE